MTAMFTITLASDEIPLGEFDAQSALEAATVAHRMWLADNKEPLDGYAYEQHGANWGRAAERLAGSGGNGAQSFHDCMRVYSDPEMSNRVAVVQFRKTEDDGDRF